MLLLPVDPAQDLGRVQVIDIVADTAECLPVDEVALLPIEDGFHADWTFVVVVGEHVASHIVGLEEAVRGAELEVRRDIASFPPAAAGWNPIEPRRILRSR